MRRQLNQTFFGRLYIDKTGAVDNQLLKAPFDDLAPLRMRRIEDARRRTNAPRPLPSWRTPYQLARPERPGS